MGHQSPCHRKAGGEAAGGTEELALESDSCARCPLTPRTPQSLLLTAFGPFGPFRRNPTQIVLERIRERREPGVETLLLPVSRRRAPAILLRRLHRGGLAGVVLTGLAAERTAVSVERLAVNLLDFPIPDVEGTLARDEPVVPGGPLALATTAPVRRLQRAVLREGVPCVLSLSAGSFLCNQVLYLALHELSGTPVPAVFVHLPPASELVAEVGDPGRPVPASLPLEALERAVRAVVREMGKAAGCRRLRGGQGGARPGSARLDRAPRRG